MIQNLFKILGLIFIFQIFMGCTNSSKKENAKIMDLSEYNFADSLWNEFASAIEAKDIDYLIKNSFDTIQCIDSIIRISYNIKWKLAPEGAYGLVFTFRKRNDKFNFAGMFTTP